MGRRKVDLDEKKTGSLPIYVKKSYFDKVSKKDHQKLVEDFTWLMLYNEDFAEIFEEFRQLVDGTEVE